MPLQRGEPPLRLLLLELLLEIAQPLERLLQLPLQLALILRARRGRRRDRRRLARLGLLQRWQLLSLLAHVGGCLLRVPPLALDAVARVGQRELRLPPATLLDKQLGAKLLQA